MLFCIKIPEYSFYFRIFALYYGFIQMNNTSTKFFLVTFLLAVIAYSVPANAALLPLSTTDSRSLLQDSLQTDSVSTDSIKPEKKDAIDAPVFYECTDSMVWASDGNAHLYGSGKVKYDKIELTANIISMNMDSSVVHATGRADTTGVVTGLPIFMDGGTPYESDRMRYNFKTRPEQESLNSLAQ